MSLSVHSHGPCVGAQDGDPRVLQAFRTIFNDALPAAASELLLDYAVLRRKGVGQFTGWMATPSNTTFEDDRSTSRGAAPSLLVLHLARQARSPWCAIDPVTWARYRQGRVMGLAAMGRGIGGVLRSPAGATTGEAVACTTSLRAPSIWLLPKFRLAPPRSTTA
jgi:hypothetical protein